MRLIESRRITGPHLLLDRAGAAAELALEPGDDLDGLLAALEDRIRALGWPVHVTTRTWRGGVSVAFEAPEDALETAAWIPDHLVLGAPPWEEVLACRDRERNPALVALLDAARARGLPVFWDDDGLTVGLGVHSHTWPLDALPSVDALAGDRIPVALVTGTNGKTTTTRLVARIAREAGFVTGHTSSDGVVVAGETVRRGDWTGPGAARQVLRDRRVELAVLETARGGLMRRGLVVTDADAAIVTNVSDDHLGEWGIDDLRATAEMKLVVAKGLRPGGTLVCNAGCAPLAEVAAPLRPVWFGYDPGPGRAAFVQDGWVILDDQPLVPIAQIPITLGGAARFNVENAVGAALLARALGLPREAIAAGLRAFRPTPEDNAGRMNVVEVGGATVMVDFAHNPDGLRQLGAVVRALPATRRLLLLGQAGDRRDEDLQALCDVVAEIGFDHVILKDLPEHRRGKAPGEVPARLRELLLARGITAHDEVADELAGVDRALAWVQPGNLALLLVHERYDEVMARLGG